MVQHGNNDKNVIMSWKHQYFDAIRRNILENCVFGFNRHKMAPESKKDLICMLLGVVLQIHMRNTGLEKILA